MASVSKKVVKTRYYLSTVKVGVTVKINDHLKEKLLSTFNLWEETKCVVKTRRDCYLEAGIKQSDNLHDQVSIQCIMTSACQTDCSNSVAPFFNLIFQHYTLENSYDWRLNISWLCFYSRAIVDFITKIQFSCFFYLWKIKWKKNIAKEK
jgi:hypothetical protein